MREYQEKTRKALLARNKAVLTRLHAAQAAKQQNIPSDDGEDADPPGDCAARGKRSTVQGVLAGILDGIILHGVVGVSCAAGLSEVSRKRCRQGLFFFYHVRFERTDQGGHLD
jgi:hypothetical protein